MTSSSIRDRSQIFSIASPYHWADLRGRRDGVMRREGEREGEREEESEAEGEKGGSGEKEGESVTS